MKKFVSALAIVLILTGCSPQVLENSPNQVSTPSSNDLELVYQEPTQPSAEAELCKIQESSQARKQYGDENTRVWTGFGEPPTHIQRNGKVRWALIPIDFPDLRGEPGFRQRIDDQMELLTRWYEIVSGGKLIIEWAVLDSWVTLPEDTKEYVIPKSVNVNDAPNGPKLFTDAMNSADPLFDFSGIQTVNFILPKGQEFIGEGSQGFPWDEVVQKYTSDEGKVSSYSIAGRFFDLDGRDYWSYWAHEYGHAIGLPHVGPNQGSPPFNPWDLMGGQDGPARELSGWLRFVVGWLDDAQVYCQEGSQVNNVEMTLVPLGDANPGYKLAVLPVSSTKSVVIESRRVTEFTCSTNPDQNGVLVYTYDSTLGHNEDFFVPITPAGRPILNSECTHNQTPDSILRSGDQVEVEGLIIEVLESRNLDRILITQK